MEILGETPPPLPPKTKLRPILAENETKNSFYIAPSNGSLKIVNNRRREEDGDSPPQYGTMPESGVTEPQSEKTPAENRVSEERKNEGEEIGPRIITWAGSVTKEKEQPMSEELYENVSNGGVNYLENRLKSIEASRDVVTVKNGTPGTAEKNSGKRKTPKIEVRQEDNKTVVKISIKDTPTPEEEMSEENRFNFVKENVYENGYLGSKGFHSLNSNVVYANCDVSDGAGSIYENANVFVGKERPSENPSEGCYENVEGSVPGERVYANVCEAVGSRPSKKELITEANYCNLNGEDSGCDQVYKNREFQVLKNNVVSIISKNSTPLAINSPERKDKDDDLYENVKTEDRVYANDNLFQNGRKMTEKYNETAEKLESRKKDKFETEKKSSVVEVSLQKPATTVKVEKSDTEFGDMSHLDDNSSGDPFDSGTCSDVDSLPTFVQSKKGNVIVTIKSLQTEEKVEDIKKSESGHRRAESLTSSGVGVDSEESDDEKSNISCDSLNSNEPYAISNSEDHGYHTPNSEDKTGSPVDHEYVIKGASAELKMKREVDFPQEEDYYENPDIIRQVADVSDKIKNLRTGNNGVFLAKLIESSDFGDYENVHMFDPPKVFKKKPAPPPPPPSKPSPFTLQRLSEEVGSDDEENSKQCLPKNLLRDIQTRNVRLSTTYPNGEKPKEEKNSSDSFTLSGKVTDAIKKLNKTNDPKRLMVEEKTYEERKTEVRSVKMNKICAMEVDTDKFYKFHLAENVGEAANGNEEETFAGLKDYLSREKPAAITSAKGTIRGVKNRVKAGIATFLQLHENKSYKDRDAGKVVVYTTTMGIVRETYHKCLKVKQILRTLMVKFEERDVFMSSEAQEEIRDRMKCDAILVPQVFVEGQHIGDAETIERLNEMGELRTILKPYKSADACSTCKVCGGYRLLPCSVCKGSKKSIHRNHFTAEFVALKCMNCDQVGLTKCHAC